MIRLRVNLYLSALLGILCLPGVNAQYSGGGEANPGLNTHEHALERFREMRFGMFIHWGPVSLRGEEISWSRGREIPIEDYDRLYEDFNPVGFNASDWVNAARSAGMKYLVITSRHHDGFSLWDSKYSEYDMVSTPYGRGILQDLAIECRKAGIEFGTYYSICDWYHPDYPVVYPDPNYTFRKERQMDPDTRERMVSSHKGNNIYLYLMEDQGRELVLPLDVGVIINRAYLLQDQTPLEVTRNSETFSLDLPDKLPDKDASVVVLEIDTPAADIELIKL